LEWSGCKKRKSYVGIQNETPLEGTGALKKRIPIKTNKGGREGEGGEKKWGKDNWCSANTRHTDGGMGGAELRHYPKTQKIDTRHRFAQGV